MEPPATQPAEEGCRPAGRPERLRRSGCSFVSDPGRDYLVSRLRHGNWGSFWHLLSVTRGNLIGTKFGGARSWGRKKHAAPRGLVSKSYLYVERIGGREDDQIGSTSYDPYSVFHGGDKARKDEAGEQGQLHQFLPIDRKSTRLNSSHSQISYAVFCLKKKKTNNTLTLMHALAMSTRPVL